MQLVGVVLVFAGIVIAGCDSDDLCTFAIGVGTGVFLMGIGAFFLARQNRIERKNNR